MVLCNTDANCITAAEVSLLEIRQVYNKVFKKSDYALLPYKIILYKKAVYAIYF